MHTCAVLDNGTAACWGANNGGQLGNGKISYSSGRTPVLVSGGAVTGRTITAISVGGQRSCAVLDNGTAACWGYNFSRPVLITGGALTGRSVTAISSGRSQICAVLDNGTAACGGFPNSSGPIIVSGGAVTGRTISTISVGYGHTCAALDNGATACWGLNNSGQLGNGSVRDSSVPQLVEGFGADLVAAGGSHTVGRWSGVATVGESSPSPAEILASQATGRNVGLIWTPPPSSGVAPISGYQIEMSSNTGRTWSGRVSVGNVDNLMIAVPRDDYWMFRIRVITDEGVAPSAWTDSNEILIQTEARTTKSNVRITFQVPDGSPIIGSKVSWQTTDGALSSAREIITDSSGTITSPLIATGPVTFLLTGGTVGSSDTHLDAASLTTVVSRSGTAISITTSSTPSVVTRVVNVQMPDGTPVPDTLLRINGAISESTSSGVTTAVRQFTSSWKYYRWISSVSTNSTGQATLKGFDVPSVGADVTVRFTDDLINQIATTSLVSPSVVVMFEQMPYVRIITPEPGTIDAGTAFPISVVAVDGTGEPITGAEISLSQLSASSTSSVSTTEVDALSSCTSKLTLKTNSRGQGSFTLCASSTATWRADGPNIVPSRGLRVSVRSSVPRSPKIPKFLKRNSSISVRNLISGSPPRGARVVITVRSSSKRICKAAGSRIRGLKAGTCRATIAVTPKATEKVRRPKTARYSVVLTVTK